MQQKDNNEEIAKVEPRTLTAAEKKERKAQTARENGAKSKGPITPEGKAKSSANSLIHGLRADKHILLPTESPEELNELLQAYVDQLKPVTKCELRLAQKLACLDWRLDRFQMLETCAFNLETAVRCDAIAARFAKMQPIGFLYEAWKGTSDTSHVLDLLRRYMTTLQHQYNSTLTNFYKFEKRRLERTKSKVDDAEPYQPPVFQFFVPPPELPAIHLVNPFPCEPTAKKISNVINNLQKPDKRPAA